jgi:hypothetical protein
LPNKDLLTWLSPSSASMFGASGLQKTSNQSKNPPSSKTSPTKCTKRASNSLRNSTILSKSKSILSTLR